MNAAAVNISAALAATANRAARGRRSNAPANTAAAYIRVSSREQADSRAGLEAQRTAIQEWADRAGVTITQWHEDAGVSGNKPPHQRPGIAAALAAVSEGEVERLIVAKVDRLSRKFVDSVNLAEMSIDQGWPLVSAREDIDMTTSNGRMMFRLLASIAEDERDRIGQRTKDALAEKKRAGVRLGRPSVLPREVIARIINLHAGGMSLGKIAKLFTEEGVPTARGGATWYPATVRAVLNSQDAASIRAEATA